MSSEEPLHPLSTPITNYGSLPIPVFDNLDIYLDELYKAKLKETLEAGYPGRAIILNLVHAYAEMGRGLFWIEDEFYREALEAFICLADHICVTDLSISDLYHVSQIVDEFFDGDLEGPGPPHLAALSSPIDALKKLFYEDRYKDAIYDALADKSRRELYEPISMAISFYGEDAFELFFKFAKTWPDEALQYSYWINGMTNAQRARFIAWVRTHMPTELLSTMRFRTQTYSKTVTSLLDSIIWRADDTLQAVHDRQNFAVWGLCSADKFLASTAAYLLEALDVSLWPTGSREVVSELYEEMEPHWTSFKRLGKTGHYTTHKERLGDLLAKANVRDDSAHTGK